MSVSLDIEWLKASLPGWQVEYHARLDSTNRHASVQGDVYSSPAVVIAQTQTAGKGRGKNQWWSSTGALTFSIVIRPQDWNIPASEQTLLSLLTASAIRQVLCDHHQIPATQLQLKWPNDLYLRERKVCGILLEQSVKAAQVLVIGIGLNVNNSWSQAPQDLQSKGIALCDVTGEPLSREQILIDLLLYFEQLLASAELRDKLLKTSWSKAHLLDGKIVTLEQSGEITAGRCEGIDDDGALLIREMHGLRRIHSAVILGWEAE